MTPLTLCSQFPDYPGTTPNLIATIPATFHVWFSGNIAAHRAALPAVVVRVTCAGADVVKYDDRLAVPPTVGDFARFAITPKAPTVRLDVLVELLDREGGTVVHRLPLVAAVMPRPAGMVWPPPKGVKSVRKTKPTKAAKAAPAEPKAQRSYKKRAATGKRKVGTLV